MMKLRLFSGTVCVATAELKTDKDFERVGHASHLIYNGDSYYFSGVYDGCINFEQGGPPVDITTWAALRPTQVDFRG